MEKIYEQWSDFVEAIENIFYRIKKEKLEFDYIYAPPRGGLCMGVVLSHKLDIPLISDEKDMVLQSHDPNQKILVVDDIVDTGKTLKPLSKFPNITIMTWHYNYRNATFKPNYYYKEVDQWVVYPWETDRSDNV